MRTAFRFLVAMLGEDRRRVAMVLAVAAVLVAATRVTPAVVGLVLAEAGPRWALGAALVAAGLLSARALVRQIASQHARARFLGSMANLVASRSLLREPGGTAARVEGVLLSSSHAAVSSLVDHAPEVLGSVVAGVILVPLIVAAGLGDVLLLTVPVMVGSALGLWWLRSIMGRHFERATHAGCELVESTSVLLRGHLDLAASGRSDRQAQRVARRAHSYAQAVAQSERAGAVGGRLPLAVGAGVTLFLAWLWLRDEPAWLTRGAVTVLMVGSVLPVMSGLGRALLDAHRSLRELRPLLAMLDAPVDPITRPGGAQLDPRAAVRWHRVSFGYAPGERVLRDLSIQWRRGESLALTGPNGSGKSTVLRLLLGLAEPDEGAIFVGATDLREGDIAQWRRSIAYLPQRPYLAEAHTLREAVETLGPDVADASLLEALEQVGLRAKLESKRPGDPLGVRVQELSSGERQRFALARVLADPAPNLVLDEPDANLDADGLARLLRVLPQLGRKRRILLVAHDPKLVACADRSVTIAAAEVAPSVAVSQTN